mmetsp:Transcript_31791/g.76998  ORF Transcript_31791/g.76998 Transcript_31791/m.76998 type:complete len:505 (-) Transcript_31791:211-1725(-)|eukprot:CAMPEP_0113634820 /NCGR_PEP_ID=MMETSP0017_2-20120614/18139_1 /TAXON_ID=2856 /ORGANISM="Cylindrotheca closterium" /LENGTH=504 /DNA_ID=CAMNT_0000545551 /DNA_START=90 /DNA_END=1604 /DNA_ORIENTATION=- /assembly_acc=CAM_ASM_000147
MSSFNTSNQAAVFDVVLPNGIRVDVRTRAGTAAFLKYSNVNYLSSKVREMRKIQKKKKLNADDEAMLGELNYFISIIAENADPCRDLFRERVAESEVQCWLEYNIEEVKRLTTSETWIKTGDIFQGLGEMIRGWIFMFSHAVPVAFAFDSDFFSALADMIKARKGEGRALPSEKICFCIAHCLVPNAVYVATSQFDNTWSTEKAFKKLEASGLLEQFLRCATAPAPQGAPVSYFGELLQSLLDFPVFLSRKFKRGDPCGDAVTAIVDGKDGSRRIRPEIMKTFQNIDGLRNAADPSGLSPMRSACAFCKERVLRSKMMTCSGCHWNQYCCSECQKGDWENHKQDCKDFSKSFSTSKARKEYWKPQDIAFTATEKFVQQNFGAFTSMMAKECMKTGLGIHDLIVELNFMRDKDGNIPAIQHPPIFKIAPRQKYVEALPLGVPCDVKDEKGRDITVDALKRIHSKITPGKVGFVVHIAGEFFFATMSLNDELKRAVESSWTNQPLE